MNIPFLKNVIKIPTLHNNSWADIDVKIEHAVFHLFKEYYENEFFPWMSKHGSAERNLKFINNEIEDLLIETNNKLDVVFSENKSTFNKLITPNLLYDDLAIQELRKKAFDEMNRLLDINENSYCGVTWSDIYYDIAILKSLYHEKIYYESMIPIETEFLRIYNWYMENYINKSPFDYPIDQEIDQKQKREQEIDANLQSIIQLRHHMWT